jgi:hypothetical protein
MSNWWKNKKRAERNAQWAREQEAMERERHRKDALIMYDRIEESDASDDVKDILHRIAEQCGLEN